MTISAPAPLSLGISDFQVLREDGFYYVDKSAFIAEFWNNPYQTVLIPRPRRFGKTLNLSLVRYFFESHETSRAHLFEGLAIQQNEQLMRHQGQYPVVYLTFKDVRGDTWQECYRKIVGLLAKLYKHFAPVLRTHLDDLDGLQFDRILNKNPYSEELSAALEFLIERIHTVLGKSPVVLVDEYDAPIHSGYAAGFYEDAVSLMRDLLGGAFKDNSHLKKGLITGILRISKESIFSGLNNVGVYTLLDDAFTNGFGFTESEVERLFSDFQVTDPETAKAWYNGYQSGNTLIYNPWSLLSFLANQQQLRPYWINSSSNDLARDLILHDSGKLHGDLETLLSGGTIITALEVNLALRDIQQRPAAVWGLLMFSGYLKLVSRVPQGRRVKYELQIPNREVMEFYHDHVSLWLERQFSEGKLEGLLHCLASGDLATFGERLQNIVQTSLSYFDTGGDNPERVYHAFVLGLLIHWDSRYHIRSNRESGLGRYDVMLLPKDTQDLGFVFEFKRKTAERSSPQTDLAAALNQIQERAYATELRDLGVKRSLGIGVVVEGKQVWVDSIEL